MGLRAGSARPQRVSGSARTDSQRAQSARNPIASHVNFDDDLAPSAFTRTQWTAAFRSRTPMVLCLSNARSGDLHFDTSFVALHVLVREIIPNTITTYIHTYIHDLSRISIDCLTPASRLRRSASV